MKQVHTKLIIQDIGKELLLNILGLDIKYMLIFNEQYAQLKEGGADKSRVVGGQLPALLCQHIATV